MEKVVFTANTKELEVNQDIIRIMERQRGTLSIKFKSPEKSEIEEIIGFFDSLADMEPLTINIMDAGEIKAYFRGTGSFDTIKEGDETIYTYEATIQELVE